MRQLLLFPLLALACGALLALPDCASDPYLSKGIVCIEAAKRIVDAGSAQRRAAAEACIKKLEDAGHVEAQGRVDVGAARVDGGAGVRGADGGSHG